MKDLNDSEYLAIMNYLAYKAYKAGYRLEWDELLGIAGLSIAKTRANYDPSRTKMKLGTLLVGGYGWGNMRGLLRSYMKEKPKQLQTMNNKVVYDQEPEWINKEYIDHILKDLKEEDRQLLKQRVAGSTLKQIGQELGVSGEAIRQRLMKISKTIKFKLKNQ